MRGLAATVNCDASFCHQTRSAGWAVWISIDGGVKHKESGTFRKRPRSSGEAEFWAMLNGVWLAVNRYGVTHVLVQGDCQGALHKLPQSRELRDIRAGVEQVVSLRTKWVKGHTTTKDARSWVNDWCDTQAKAHMRKQRKLVPKRSKKQVHA